MAAPTLQNLGTWDVLHDRLGLCYLNATLKERDIKVNETVIIANPYDLRKRIYAKVVLLFDDRPYEAKVQLPNGSTHIISGIFIEKVS